MKGHDTKKLLNLITAIKAISAHMKSQSYIQKWYEHHLIEFTSALKEVLSVVYYYYLVCSYSVSGKPSLNLHCILLLQHKADKNRKGELAVTCNMCYKTLWKHR